MTTNETMIAAALRVGGEIYGYKEHIATEVWESMSKGEQEAYKLEIRLKVAEEARKAGFLKHTEVWVTDVPDSGGRATLVSNEGVPDWM